MSSLRQRQRARRQRAPMAKAKADLAAKRVLIERGIEHLLSLLEQLDGDPDDERTAEDDEPAEEDEGAQCDDDGMGDPALNPDSEPNGDDEPGDHGGCAWQDEGDQGKLAAHPVYVVLLKEPRRETLATETAARAPTPGRDPARRPGEACLQRY